MYANGVSCDPYPYLYAFSFTLLALISPLSFVFIIFAMINHDVRYYFRNFYT